MNIQLFLAKAYCHFFKHKRGKRVSVVGGLAAYSCSRCGAAWTRKVKVKP